jgi:tetratricopeptide (TPR) repeat protein
MTAQRWEKIKEIFDSALDQAPEERASFVERACAGDEELRHEVTRLLREFEKAEGTKTCLNEPIACLSQSLARGDLIAGRYRVVQLLGRGGMGEVYEARDELLKEAIALKTLRAELCYEGSFLRRFQTEIQIARQVTHPSVCRVFEVGVHEFPDASRPPLHFFTMQLLKGETLAARIRRGGRISRSQAFPMIVQMAEGLGAAHSEGIVHRDFKSANVMVTKDRAVITDFGLAGLEAGRAAVAGAGSISMGAKLAGTVPYMSPEQMSGGSITTVSDIYSLGVVMFEMATGQLPFDGRHIIQSAMQRVRGQPPSARALAPDIDPRWEAAIRRCLEVEPARRFENASELAAVFQEDQWRLPRLYWTRRQYALAATGAAASLALGGTWWTWSRRTYQPKPEAMAWYERGVEALRAVTYEAARRDLEKAVAIDSRYAPAYADLAAAYAELDASERAKETMLQAVSIAQDERLSERDAARVKAIQYVISRDFDRAQPMFEQLLALAPGREKAGAYVDLAWLAFKRENSPAAVPALEHALNLDPGHAGAKLRMAIAVDRQGKKDAAQKLFEEAEGLFHAASNYDGEVETILQRGISLGRGNRTAEAVALIERGMGIAISTGDVGHEIKLLLALGLAYQNTAEITRSQEAAERAVKMAMEKRMDATAANGLLDLGNAYFLRGEPDEAERYFQQGLELAIRGRAQYGKARAQLSLVALYLQYERSIEVAQYVQPALTFFRAAGYRRESMQALLALGMTQEGLAQLENAEKNLLEAIRLAEEIHDAEQVGVARLYLEGVLEDAGKWQEAMAETNRGLAILGDMRGGYRAAFALTVRGRLLAKLARFREAEADLVQARMRTEKLQGKQAQLRARLALGEAELAYYQGRWDHALQQAREAAAAHGGVDDDLEAEMLAGLSAIQLGEIQRGLAECESAIRGGKQKARIYSAAAGKLGLASALCAKGDLKRGAKLAQEALGFFEQHRVWEAIWRCHRIIAGRATSGEHLEGARTALAELKRTWPEDMVRSYLARPDLKGAAALVTLK